MHNFKMIIRKNNDNEEYIAYGYIATVGGRSGMLHASGSTFSEAITNLLDLYNK